MPERIQRDVFRAEGHTLKIEMSERGGNGGEKETARLEAVALKDRLTVQATDLKLVCLVSGESTLQLLREFRPVLGGLDILQDLVEFPTERLVRSSQELVAHPDVDRSADDGQHDGEHQPVPEREPPA